MNNSVFGETRENIRKHRNIKLVTTEEKYLCMVMNPNFKSGVQFGENLMGCEMGKIKVVIRKDQNSVREQGITIASILTAIGMAIGVLVEALLPGGGAAATSGGEPPPKDEKGLKGWIRNKLKALASLLGKLGMKAAEALPGIIGGIISWIVNRGKDVVGWALVVGIGGLISTYMVTRK